MSNEISRRQFLENIGLGTAAGTSLLLLKDVASAKPGTNVLPSRTLGRTGAKVSILAFGCGSRADLEQWETRLKELGIANGGVVDAPYGSGLSFRDPDNIALEFFAPPG